MLSLWQVSTENGQAQRADLVRQVVADIAGRFAIALTTYDYAHLNVQLLQVGKVSSPPVRDRVIISSSDVASAKASSLGEVSDSIVVSLTSFRADVLIGTSQVVKNTFTVAGTTLTGLIDITVSRLNGDWLVTDYRWLLAPGSTP